MANIKPLDETNKKFYTWRNHMSTSGVKFKGAKTAEQCQKECYDDPNCKAWENCKEAKPNCRGCFHSTGMDTPPDLRFQDGFHAELVRAPYTSVSSIPSDHTVVATCDDNTMCEKPECEGADVYYGRGNKLNKMTNAPASFFCSDVYLGDPITGAKSCKCVKSNADIMGQKTHTTSMPPNRLHTHASGEGDTINSCQGQDVYFGADGSYTKITNAPASFECTNADFGGDPKPNVRKQCHCFPAGTPLTDNAALLSAAKRELAAERAAEQTAENQLKNLNRETSQINSEINSLTSQINKINKATTSLQKDVSIRSSEISAAEAQLNRQKAILEEKRNILITRNRMLQLSQDRNIYKQKVIYTLLALIIVCFVLVLVGYVSFKKVAGM